MLESKKSTKPSLKNLRPLLLSALDTKCVTFDFLIVIQYRNKKSHSYKTCSYKCLVIEGEIYEN